MKPPLSEGHSRRTTPFLTQFLSFVAPVVFFLLGQKKTTKHLFVQELISSAAFCHHPAPFNGLDLVFIVFFVFFIYSLSSDELSTVLPLFRDVELRDMAGISIFFSIVIVLMNNIPEDFEETADWSVAVVQDSAERRAPNLPNHRAPPRLLTSHLPPSQITVFYLEKVLFSAYTEMMHYKLLSDPHVFRGHVYLYICVHMYLRYFFFFSSLEFVFVFGSMRIWAELFPASLLHFD